MKKKYLEHQTLGWWVLCPEIQGNQQFILKIDEFMHNRAISIFSSHKRANSWTEPWATVGITKIKVVHLLYNLTLNWGCLSSHWILIMRKILNTAYSVQYATAAAAAVSVESWRSLSVAEALVALFFLMTSLLLG